MFAYINFLHHHHCRRRLLPFQIHINTTVRRIKLNIFSTTTRILTNNKKIHHLFNNIMKIAIINWNNYLQNYLNNNKKNRHLIQIPNDLVAGY